MSQEFDIRQRVGENRIGRSAVDPEGLLVRGDADAVGVAFAPPAAAEPCRLVRGLDSRHVRALRKIHHREAVQRAKVYEDPATRAVGGILNCNRIYSSVVLNLPSGFLLLEIKDDYKTSPRRAGSDILAIGRHGEIVQSSSYGDALYLLQGGGVDDIQGPRVFRLRARISDTDQDQLSILSRLGFIGPTAERNLFNNFLALPIHHDEEVTFGVGPAEDIEQAAVGRESNHLR